MKNKFVLALLLASIATFVHAQDAPETAPAPTPSPFANCSTALLAGIGQLVQNDTRGILALQFNVTTLKLAKRLHTDNQANLEAAIRANSQRLNQLNLADPTVLTRLGSLYRAQTGNNRLSDIQQSVADLQGKIPSLNYFRRTNRLSNRDVSNYILAEQVSSADSGFNEMDVAITWFMHNASEAAAAESGAGSARHNLSLVSTKLAHQLGTVGQRQSLESINQRLTAAETQLNQAMGELATGVTAQLPQCFPDGKWLGVTTANSDFFKNAIGQFIRFNGIPTPQGDCLGPVGLTVAAPVEVAAALVEEDTAQIEEAAEPIEEAAAPIEEVAAPVEVAAAPVEVAAAPVEEAADPSAMSLDATLAELRSGRMRFIGRVDGDGIEGGNWSCIYANARVYAVLEGCRPSRTQVPTAFRVHVIRHDGRMLDIYINGEMTPYNVDDPTSIANWSLIARAGNPIGANSTASEVRDYLRAAEENYNSPICSATRSGTPTCNNGGVPGAATLQSDALAPGNRVRLIHDLIVPIPR